MTYNRDAYAQRHDPAYRLQASDTVDRLLCPCRCGRLLTPKWVQDIWGYTPRQLGRLDPIQAYQAGLPLQPVPFVDPTDDPVQYPELNGRPE